MKYCVHSAIDPERWLQVNHSGAKRFRCNPWLHTCFKLKPFWRMNFCLSKAWKVMMMRMRKIASENTKLQILADVYKLEGHSPLPFPCLLLLGWLITIFFWPSSADIKRQHKFGSPWNQPDLRSIFFPSQLLKITSSRGALRTFAKNSSPHRSPVAREKNSQL